MIRNLQLRQFGVAIPTDRVQGGARVRASVRPDEDAVTLAARAAASVVGAEGESIGAIVFATTTPPYSEGGSVQPLAELLGLQGRLFALELNASTRDGLAAIFVAEGLAALGMTVLVVAANADAEDSSTGDGAVALLVGPPRTDVSDSSLAVLRPLASSVIELRDRWRRSAGSVTRDADRSFVEEIGTEKVATDLLAALSANDRVAVSVTGPDRRGARSVERAFGDADDQVLGLVGALGSAHALVRMILGLDRNRISVAVSNGIADAVLVEPTARGSKASSELLSALAGAGRDVTEAMHAAAAEGFDPSASGPRAWRDRDQDFRLKGILGDASNGSVPTVEPPEGSVIARTEDRVFPGASVTEMVAVRLDTGGQFYGQVAMGETLAIGDRARLEPRVLHTGGDVVQYFWKAVPCP